MFDVASDLTNALNGARERLAADARSAALSQTRFGSPNIDRRMAALAQDAIFAEALLSAEHARLAEIKSATK